MSRNFFQSCSGYVSRTSTDSAGPAGTVQEIEVTSEMVEVGVGAFLDSKRAEYESDTDRLLVAAMLRAALEARQRSQQNR